LLFCYLGVFILVTRLDFSAPLQFDMLGLCLAVLSTLLWSLYWLVNARTGAPAIASILLSFLCAVPWLLGLTIIHWQEFNFSSASILSSVYIGLFEMSISFVLWLQAMKYAKNTAQISALVYLSPFVSLLLINQFTGEHIYSTTILALVVICLGLFIQRSLGTKSRTTA